MKLNVQERLTLVNLLPEKGNFETMSTVEKMKELLYPSEKEVDEFEIKQTENRITWNKKGSENIEIELTEKHTSMLKGILENLSNEDSLDSAQYQILKRFRETKE